jgi:hypothetical protein
MLRFTITAGVVLIGVIATLPAYVPEEQPSPSSVVDESEFNDKTREMVVCYTCFKEALTTTIDLLQEDKITLREARDRVYETAQRHWPEYLVNLERVEQGTTHQERVARNLLGHLRSLAECDLTALPRVRAVEMELTEMIRQEFTGRPSQS